MGTRVGNNDIVTDILDRIALKVGILPKQTQSALEREIRRDWGGERPYIAKSSETYREELRARNESIREEHRRGEHIELLIRRHGISRRRLLQILARNDLP